MRKAQASHQSKSKDKLIKVNNDALSCTSQRKAATSDHDQNEPTIPQMVYIKDSDILEPKFNEQMELSKKANFMQREKIRLSVNESQTYSTISDTGETRAM